MPNVQPAVVNYGPQPHSVELREIPVPAIGPDDVLLKIAAVGVCGSDLHQWTAEHSWPVNYPVTLGHEFAGTTRSAVPMSNRLWTAIESAAKRPPLSIRTACFPGSVVTIWTRHDEDLSRSRWSRLICSRPSSLFKPSPPSLFESGRIDGTVLRRVQGGINVTSHREIES